MSLLRRVRAEWSGALRSVRYDIGRRPVEPPSRGPDMTSTGMNTFGGLGIEEPAEKPGQARVPKRAALVTALGVLTVVGAAGAYLGVVDGLGAILNTSQAEAGTVPSAPGETNSGIGRGPTKAKNPINSAEAPALAPTTPAPAGLVAPAAATAPGAPGAGRATASGPGATTARQKTSPIRTTNPANGLPPVPTPTVPESDPTPSASAGPSTSAGPSPSETSATPTDSAEPSDSPQPRHRRWHH